MEIESPTHHGDSLDSEIIEKKGTVTEEPVDPNDSPVEGIEDAGVDGLGFQGDEKEEYVNGNPVIRNGRLYLDCFILLQHFC